tara:strand:- start:1242 stop:1559 length:318 start_codon:yes stop_codon:yes gene_type:complete
MKFRVKVIESKNKIFVHLDIKNSTTVEIKEWKIREELNKMGLTPGELIKQTKDLFVYNFINMVDLTTSYGASSLETASPEITDPKPKPKTTRRRRTRKTTPKTTK